MSDGDDEEWRFSVDDVGEDGEADGAEGTDEADESAEGSIFGPPPEADASVDPGDPDAENVLFVVLGVAVSVGTMAAVVGLF